MIIPPNPNRGSHNLWLIDGSPTAPRSTGARAEMENLITNWRAMAFRHAAGAGQLKRRVQGAGTHPAMVIVSVLIR